MMQTNHAHVRMRCKKNRMLSLAIGAMGRLGPIRPLGPLAVVSRQVAREPREILQRIHAARAR